MWAYCLQKLKIYREFIGVALRIFEVTQSLMIPFSPSVWSFNEIIQFSCRLDEPINVSSSTFFNEPKLELYVQQKPGQNGFEVVLRIQSGFRETFEAQSVRLQATERGEESLNGILISSKGAVTFREGPNEITLSSKVEA